MLKVKTLLARLKFLEFFAAALFVTIAATAYTQSAPKEVILGMSLGLSLSWHFLAKSYYWLGRAQGSIETRILILGEGPDDLSR